MKKTALLTTAFLSTCAPAHAQQYTNMMIACNTTDQVLGSLQSERWNEAQRFYGVNGGERLDRLWVNEETGTYTFTRSTANGITCILSAGEFSGFVTNAPKPNL